MEFYYIGFTYSRLNANFVELISLTVVPMICFSFEIGIIGLLCPGLLIIGPRYGTFY